MIPGARLEDITEADIQRLIDHSVREGRTLDFKDRLDLSDDGKRTLSEDVCAFANAIGGDLVFGLVPTDKREGDSAVAQSIAPIHVPNLDVTLQTLVNTARDSLEPQLATVQAHPVRLATGGHVIVLRVGASPNAPHRVVRDRGGHFFLRNSVGKERMDIHAIRSAFAFSAGLAERARGFRDARLASLRERRSQVALRPGPLLVVHLIPVLSLTRADTHSIAQLKGAAGHLQRAQPGCNLLGRVATNFEGVICTSSSDAQGQHHAYAQAFRDGCLELVGAMLTIDRFEPPRPTLVPQQYEQTLVQHDLPAAFRSLASLDIPAPAYLCVSFLNVHRLQVETYNAFGPMYPTLPAHLADIVSAPIYLDTFDVVPADIVRPALDPLWNAVGIDRSQTPLLA
jgi:hypothetical protein